MVAQCNKAVEVEQRTPWTQYAHKLLTHGRVQGCQADKGDWRAGLQAGRALIDPGVTAVVDIIRSQSKISKQCLLFHPPPA